MRGCLLALFFAGEANGGLLKMLMCSVWTVQGDLAFLFVLSANDKQWAQSSGKLKQLVELFRA